MVDIYLFHRFQMHKLNDINKDKIQVTRSFKIPKFLQTKITNAQISQYH